MKGKRYKFNIDRLGISLSMKRVKRTEEHRDMSEAMKKTWKKREEDWL